MNLLFFINSYIISTSAYKNNIGRHNKLKTICTISIVLTELLVRTDDNKYKIKYPINEINMQIFFADGFNVASIDIAPIVKPRLIIAIMIRTIRMLV